MHSFVVPGSGGSFMHLSRASINNSISVSVEEACNEGNVKPGESLCVICLPSSFLLGAAAKAGSGAVSSDDSCNVLYHIACLYLVSRRVGYSFRSIPILTMHQMESSCTTLRAVPVNIDINHSSSPSHKPLELKFAMYWSKSRPLVASYHVGPGNCLHQDLIQRIKSSL